METARRNKSFSQLGNQNCFISGYPNLNLKTFQIEKKSKIEKFPNSADASTNTMPTYQHNEFGHKRFGIKNKNSSSKSMKQILTFS